LEKQASYRLSENDEIREIKKQTLYGF